MIPKEWIDEFIQDTKLDNKARWVQLIEHESALENDIHCTGCGWYISKATFFQTKSSSDWTCKKCGMIMSDIGMKYICTPKK